MKRFSIIILIVFSILKLGLTQEANKRTLRGTVLAYGKPMIGATI